MATLEDSIYTYLLSQSSITAYVGDRIYFVDSEQDETQDYIRYGVVVPSNSPVSFSDTTTAQPLVQFDVFSQSKANALTIANLLVTALHGFSGTLGVGGNTVTTSTADGPVVIADESAPGWYHGIVDWRVEYTR